MLTKLSGGQFGEVIYRLKIDDSELISEYRSLRERAEDLVLHIIKRGGDLSPLKDYLKKILPSSQVEIDGLANEIVLTGEPSKNASPDSHKEELPREAKPYIELLAKLLNGQFGEVIYRLKIDDSELISEYRSLRERAEDLVLHIIKRGGDLSQLKKQLQKIFHSSPLLKDCDTLPDKIN